VNGAGAVRALPRVFGRDDIAMTYDVFISYQRQNAPVAAALEKRLIDKGLRVFRDVTRLQAADHVHVVIPEAIKHSDVVIVLWSERSVESPWVMKEALGAKMSGRYLGLTVDGCSRNKIPEEWRSLHAPSLESFDGDDAGLLAAIERVKGERQAFDIHNSMPTSGQGDQLIGRDTELALLHTAWAEGRTNLVVLDAMGGTGKTALLNRFLADLGNQGWGGAERVYAWSFYSQGTDDKRQGDADGFFDHALTFFGYRGEPVKGAERGRRLAALMREKRTLVVLDGLEPLQYPAHSPGLEGKLKDDSLAALVKALSDQMNGLVVITTRIPIPELKTKTEPAVIRRGLNQLSTDHGVTLLKVLGVKAGEKDLRAVVDLLRGHALSLNLLASYTTTMTDGLLPSTEEIKRLLTDPELGGDSYVMMRRYEILLEDRAAEQRKAGDGDASAARQLALLYMIGLFDRPAEQAALDVLKAEPIAGLTDALDDLSPSKWKAAVDALRRVKLLLPKDDTARDEIDAHPLIREYFGKRLKETKPDAFRAANARLYQYYKLRDIPPAFHDEVRYGLVALAGARREEFQQVFGALMAGQFPADLQYLLPPVLRGIPPERLRSALDGLDDAGFNAAVRASQPENVKDMDAVLAAIAHGCAAGVAGCGFHRDVLSATGAGQRGVRGPQARGLRRGAVGARAFLRRAFRVALAQPCSGRAVSGARQRCILSARHGPPDRGAGADGGGASTVRRGGGLE
jgi:hypothetical protein